MKQGQRLKQDWMHEPFRPSVEAISAFRTQTLVEKFGVFC
jgi:hypothetical protein